MTAETWKVQLNARLLSLSVVKGLICARYPVWKHCLFIICVVSGGIGVPLERRIASFFLSPAGVTLSTCDKRPPSLLASVLFILLVCHKPFAQLLWLSGIIA